jgi:hypothetical protein
MLLLKKLRFEAVCFMFLKKLRLEVGWNVSCCFLKNLDSKLYGMLHVVSEKTRLEAVLDSKLYGMFHVASEKTRSCMECLMLFLKKLRLETVWNATGCF